MTAQTPFEWVVTAVLTIVLFAGAGVLSGGDFLPLVAAGMAGVLGGPAIARRLRRRRPR